MGDGFGELGLVGVGTLLKLTRRPFLVALWKRWRVVEVVMIIDYYRSAATMLLLVVVGRLLSRGDGGGG